MNRLQNAVRFTNNVFKLIDVDGHSFGGFEVRLKVGVGEVPMFVNEQVRQRS